MIKRIDQTLLLLTRSGTFQFIAILAAIAGIATFIFDVSERSDDRKVRTMGLVSNFISQMNEEKLLNNRSTLKNLFDVYQVLREEGLNIPLKDYNLKERLFVQVEGMLADLDNSSMEKSTIFISNFENSSFFSVKLEDCFLFGNNFNKAFLPFAKLNGCVFGSNDFSGANFEHADLAHSYFFDINEEFHNNGVFIDVNESGEYEIESCQKDSMGACKTLVASKTEAMRKSSFEKAKFAGADLTGVIFQNIDLSKAEGLTKENLKNACVTRDTKLPLYLENLPRCNPYEFTREKKTKKSNPDN